MYSSDEPSAISVAMARLDLQPGVAFESKVAQLAQLVAAHKTVSSLTFFMKVILYKINRVRPRKQTLTSAIWFLAKHKPSMPYVMQTCSNICPIK